jgi:hypothetical protein
MQLDIKGLQEAQDANLRLIAAVKPNGALGRAVQYATIAAQRYMVSVTHVDTGALRASERMSLNGEVGRIYIDANAINPHGQRPSVYGVFEHGRGGEHAFMARTYYEAGERILMQAGERLLRELP